MGVTHEKRQSVGLVVLGSGGAGAMTTGSLLLEAAGRCGFYGLMTRSVGPQIRGGEAAAFVRLATQPVGCMADSFDLLIAIDWHNAGRFSDEIVLSADSLLLGDQERGEPPQAFISSGARHEPIGLKALAEEIPGGRPNMVALGLAAGCVGLTRNDLAPVIETRLAEKGHAAVAASMAAVEAGLAAAQRLGCEYPLAAPSGETGQRWHISGNEATALGALRGGVRFAAAYPITPATEVLERLSPALRRIGGSLVQAEDELASINMAIGASFGGIPALTATSGPGFALMVEALGLATAAEIPVVIVDVMRAGPSTGIPTKSEQSDLNIAVYGCHGDAPHAVVAPLSVGDCLFTTQWAVHLAESMQVPAVVLSDQFLGQSQAVLPAPAEIVFATRRCVAAAPDTAYRRYALTADGISPMALPGDPGGQYTADGLTHDESGAPSSRAADHARHLDKRRRKLECFDYGRHWAEIEGDGDIVLLTWGSLSAAAREAAARLAAEGLPVRVVALRLIAPLRTEALAEALGTRRVLVVEQSHSAQFRNYLRGLGLLTGETRCLHRPGPLSIRPAEIRDAVLEWSQP